MLLTHDEYASLKRLSSKPNVGFWAYIARNPHLLIAAGFDEVRVEPSTFARRFKRLRDRTRSLAYGDSESNPSHSFLERRRVFEERQHEEEALCELVMGLNCRQAQSGAWYKADPKTKVVWLPPLRPNTRRTAAMNEAAILAMLGTPNMSLQTLPLASGAYRLSLTPDSILTGCAKTLTNEDVAGALVLPELWFPPGTRQSIEIVDATRSLLCALKAEKVSLHALKWQDLERIVAELLRDRGMEVTATSRGADGGRDLIAKGELIPGEPAVLAVEVKHKAIVGLDEVRSRLHANSDFPALLFATSGRFTAGVVREKRRPGNYLRLFLKDGIALSQWISAYGTPAPRDTKRPARARK